MKQLKDKLTEPLNCIENFDVLCKLSNRKFNRNRDEWNKYQKIALKIPNLNPKHKYIILAIKVRNYISSNNQELFFNAFDELTSFISKNKHLKEEYTDWAVLHVEKYTILGEYENAILFGEKILNEIEDEVVKKWSLKKQIALSFHRTGNVSKALQYYEEALELATLHHLEISIADILFDIAALYAENESLTNAKKYFHQALSKYVELNDVEYIISTLSAIASVHSGLNEFREANKYYQQTIEQIHKYQFFGQYIHILTNFGYSRLKQKNYEEYFKLEKTILDYIKDNNIKLNSNTAYFFYNTNAKAYLESSKYKKAMFWIHKAEQEEAAKNDLKAKVNISKLKLEIAKQSKKIDEIIAYYDKYIQLREELVNESKFKSIEEFEAKYQNTIKEKEKEILRLQKIEMEQKALRAQLNPHFFFNSLNSINKFIVDNDSENASKFLFQFSSLMRKTLENSEESFITIEDEVDYLKDYLSLEQLRFNFSFKYNIIVDEEIEDDFTKIPTMMLQPYVENCIKHGIYGVENGLIKIEFFQEENHIICTIEDNGKGRGESISNHKSMGTSILENRIEILKKQYNLDFIVEIIDLKNANNEAVGTKVVLHIPNIDLV